MFDRQQIESMPGHMQPSVRCRVEVAYEDGFGDKRYGTKDTSGRIHVDGNNPWVVCMMGGKTLEFRVSWGLLLEVINNRHEPPIYMNQDHPVVLEV
jgi:hypothetical protein